MYRIDTEFPEAPLEVIVGDAKTSGRVYVPKEMIGRKVVVALVPEDAPKNAVGMPTEELIKQLTGAIDMPLEMCKESFDNCIPLGELPSAKYPDEVSYDDAVNELLEVVRSASVRDMDPRQAFCFGAFVGILYQPHMKREFALKADEFLKGKRSKV